MIVICWNEIFKFRIWGSPPPPNRMNIQHYDRKDRLCLNSVRTSETPGDCICWTLEQEL